MITPAGLVLLGAIAGLGVQMARLRRRWSVGDAGWRGSRTPICTRCTT